MSKQRSSKLGVTSLRNVPGKSMIVAAVALLGGVITLGVTAGVQWAVGFAAIALTLLMQLATSWKQARVQTARFQLLRGRIEKVNREVSKLANATTALKASVQEVSAPIVVTSPASAPKSQKPAVQSAVHAVAPMPQQMIDLQREIDYLLWRITSLEHGDAIHQQNKRTASAPVGHVGGTNAE